MIDNGTEPSDVLVIEVIARHGDQPEVAVKVSGWAGEMLVVVDQIINEQLCRRSTAVPQLGGVRGPADQGIHRKSDSDSDSACRGSPIRRERPYNMLGTRSDESGAAYKQATQSVVAPPARVQTFTD